MIKNYTNYTAEDLLNDSFFISSIINPTQESIDFWNQQLEDNKISKKEFDLAISFINTIGYKKHFLSVEDKAGIWEHIKNTNKLYVNKRKRLTLFIKTSAAACITLLLTFSFLYVKRGFTSDTDILVIANDIKPLQEITDTRLILSEEEHIEVIEQDAVIEHQPEGDIKVNEQIVSSSPSSDKEKTDTQIKPRQLIVPKGKRSTLILEDGSKLWVNSGSRVVYPKQFSDKKREIFVEGEVYLEVTQNKDIPFFVKTEDFEVQVVGTSFNISTYKEFETSKVVLVEGVIDIKDNKNVKSRLLPNQLILINKEGLGEKKTVNVDDYICWTKGILNLYTEPLKNVISKLNIYYGTNIEIDSSITENLPISGKLDLRDKIEDVIRLISITAPVYYEKQNDKIIIIKRSDDK